MGVDAQGYATMPSQPVNLPMAAVVWRPECEPLFPQNAPVVGSPDPRRGTDGPCVQLNALLALPRFSSLCDLMVLAGPDAAAASSAAAAHTSGARLPLYSEADQHTHALPQQEEEAIPIGAGVTVRGVVIAHQREGVVIEVVPEARASRPIQITLPPHVIRTEENCTMYSTTACGTELVRVSGSTGEDKCCDNRLWKTPKPYLAVQKLFAFFLVAVLSWAVALATFIVSVVLIPFLIGLPIFRCSAITWRWLAHRQLGMLLELEPLSTGCTLSYPSARIPGGSTWDYASQCHTWSCLTFVFICFPLTLYTFLFTIITLPLSLVLVIFIIGIPILIAMTNVHRGLRMAVRNVAICCIATRLEGESSVPETAALCPTGVVAVPAEPHREGANDDNIAGGGASFSNDSDEWQPSPEEVTAVFSASATGVPAAKCDYGNAGGEAAAEAVGYQASTFTRVTTRDRTSEEAAALERFQIAWGRIFGNRQCTLQDIVIAPPRAVGLGPRHFIRVADNVDEARRAQLVKAYKTAFSAMYVHIMDADEQRQHCGPDFSGFFE